MIQFFLQEELKKRDIRRTNFAHKARIRPDTITAICKGNIKRVPVDALDRICQTLNCKLSDIMTYTRSKEEPRMKITLDLTPEQFHEIKRMIQTELDEQKLNAEKATYNCLPTPKLLSPKELETWEKGVEECREYAKKRVQILSEIRDILSNA